jgi:hypothetical protein
VPLVSTLCEKAAQELNVIMPGEALSANDGAWLLGKLNQLFGEWNTKKQAIYRSVPSTHTLTSSLSPHTIGPTGTFVVAQRPVEIDAANLILTGGSKTEIRVRDREWYQSLALPSMSIATPADLYYDPSWPNGSIYFEGVPSTAYGLELWTRLVFATVALTDTVTFPQGYEGAIIDTLAEDSAEGLGRQPGPKLMERARRRRADLYALNDPTPRMVTVDAGMPGGRWGGRGSYLTGWR